MVGHLTKSERIVIETLGWGEVPDRSFDELRRAAGLTIRGIRIVLHRLEEGNLIGRREGAGINFYTTFRGARWAGLTGT